MAPEEAVPESPQTDEEHGQIPATTAEEQGPPRGWRLLATALAALGVVYGDIGTSPLYALRMCFSGDYGIEVVRANILGVLSLILWSLILVISVKYLLLVLRADNRGEGGILALMALAGAKGDRSDRSAALLIALGLFGAALLYGDGMITPAISVLSAIEGIEVATPAFKTYVEPITVVVLIALFLFQKRGTAVVGSVFGSVILFWFALLGVLGVLSIIQTPGVLTAILPTHAVEFFHAKPVKAYFVLGAVFLVVTGGEALYADMGHFGKRPIRFAWFGLVLPALVLNYFGQGALLLRDASAVKNPFYHLAPSWALYPVVVIAATATVIASQAVISGSFSLARQAVHLGYSPRMRIEHTSDEEIGQVYIRSVNWVLCAATVGLVIGFGSSTALAGAYGVAVTVTMVVTTLLLYVVMHDIWGWGVLVSAPIAAGLLIIDLAFLGANLVKVPNGGWFPLIVAVVAYTLMATWRRGRQLVERQLYKQLQPVEGYIHGLELSSVRRVDGTAVFLTGNAQGTPSALLNNIEHNQVLHKKIVLLTISTRSVPRVLHHERLKVDDLGRGFWRVQATYGFMQTPDVTRLLEQVKDQGLDIDLEQTTYFLTRRIPVTTSKPGMAQWRERLYAIMARNQQSVATYYDIPPDRIIEIGTHIEI